MPYKSFDAKAEVNGLTVLSFINALPAYTSVMKEILERNGISNLRPDGWYNQQSWLNCLKEVSDTYGQFTLMSIGKALADGIPAHLELDFKTSLTNINSGYGSSHRNGNVGYCDLLTYDEEGRKALLRADNPYPVDFEKGVILGLLRRFKPNVKGIAPKVEVLHEEEESDDRVYSITW